jgi:catechol 2,3-dioxygenase-like lactoylglutathione lyase family enzyme
LNGISHIALITNDIHRLRSFYAAVFDVEVGPTKPHGDRGDETMTMIGIGPHTELNVVRIEGDPEPDRQTSLVARGANDGDVNDFAPCAVCSCVAATDSKAKCSSRDSQIHPP